MVWAEVLAVVEVTEEADPWHAQQSGALVGDSLTGGSPVADTENFGTAEVQCAFARAGVNQISETIGHVARVDDLKGEMGCGDEQRIAQEHVALGTSATTVTTTGCGCAGRGRAATVRRAKSPGGE